MLACTFVHRKFIGRTRGQSGLSRFPWGIRNEALLTEPDEAWSPSSARAERNSGRKNDQSQCRAGTYASFAMARAMAQYAVATRSAPLASRARGRSARPAPGRNAYDGIGIPDCIRLGARRRESFWPRTLRSPLLARYHRQNHCALMFGVMENGVCG